MDVISKEDMRDHCLQVLSDAGATTDVSRFYADVLQCEYDMTHSTYRLQKELSTEFVKQPVDCAVLFSVMQCLSKKFYHWKCRISSLAEQGAGIPPLQFNPDKLNEAEGCLKAVCSLETNEVNMHEGDELVVTDATSPNRLKIRNPRGEEGYVPALSCVLPTPDYNASNAIERLQIHLLTSWTDCIRKVKLLFFDNLTSICNMLYNAWNNGRHHRVPMKDRDRVRRRFRRVLDAATIQPRGLDLGRLHTALFSLEKELTSLQYVDLSEITRDVANVDKAVLCCHNLYKQYQLYRESLKDAPRPIHIVRRLEHLRQVAHGQNFKYYELKMTLEDVDVTEEIIYVPTSRSRKASQRRSSERDSQTQPVSPLPGGVGIHHEALAAEQLTTSTHEERQHFVIRSVADPRPEANGKHLTMKDAIEAGILVPHRGIYRNPSTGDEQAIPTAMNDGLIRVEYSTKTKTAEKTKAIGLITIRTQNDHREFKVTGAVDSVTAEHVDAAEARARGIIVDDGGGYYVIETTGERIPLPEAIDEGWVTVAFEELPEGVQPEVEVHTYAVSEVLDPLLNSDVSFSDAVRRGIIDRETGNYVDRRSGESVPVAEAIQRGLMKAKLVEGDELGLQVDKSNALVVERFAKAGKNVLKELRVMKAFKAAGASHR